MTAFGGGCAYWNAVYIVEQNRLMVLKNHNGGRDAALNLQCAEVIYNYFRTYDPQTGMYIESDPIGLRGHVGSTYAYE